MNSRTNRVLFATAISAVISVILFVLYQFSTEGSVFNRFVVLFGGNFFNGGYVQFITFVAFWWGVLEVEYFKRLNRREGSYLKTGVLPEEEHITLNEKDVNQIRLRIQSYIVQKEQDKQPLYLLHVIKKAAEKFRSNLSVSEAFQLAESQCRINVNKVEGEHATIRYLVWAIPSIGFIGTVIGISNALYIANSGDIDLITSTLGVAFDTTLVALILSLILYYMVHVLEEQTYTLHAEIEEYVSHNLISRIDLN